MKKPEPTLYMIGGPNGAGKTTTAMAIMPDLINCHEYVNADAIASGLSPFRPNEVSIDAGRLMIERIHELARKKADFAFETTMASRSFAPFIKKCKDTGYRVHCVYMWLQSPELSIARVADRVAEGGHFVPDEIVRTRYTRGLANFFKLYMPIADSWGCYDNSNPNIQLIAEQPGDGCLRIVNKHIWNSISKDYYNGPK